MTLRDDKLWHNRKSGGRKEMKVGILDIRKDQLYWKDKKVEDLTKEELVVAMYETIAVLEEIKGLIGDRNGNNLPK